MYKAGDQFRYRKDLDTTDLRDVCARAVVNQSVITAVEDQEDGKILCKCPDFGSNSIRIRVGNLVPITLSKEEVEKRHRKGELTDEQYLNALLTVSS